MLRCYVGIKMQDDDSGRPKAGTLLGAEDETLKESSTIHFRSQETFGEVKAVPGQGPPRHSHGPWLETGPLLLCGRGGWPGWPFTNCM